MELSTPFLPKLESSKVCEDDSLDDNLVITSSRVRQKHSSPTACRLLITLLAVWGAVSVVLQLIELVHWNRGRPVAPDVYRPWTLEKDRNLCDCGTTIREALSRECVYDALATAWLPPYCRDDKLTEIFNRSGPGPNGTWPYYADKDGKILLDESQIATLGESGGTFWALRDWHILHCTFYWEKYVRLRVTGAVMERRFDSVPHVRHCTRLIMHKPPHNELIEVPVVMNSRPLSEEQEARLGHEEHGP